MRPALVVPLDEFMAFWNPGVLESWSLGIFGGFVAVGRFGGISRIGNLEAGHNLGIYLWPSGATANLKESPELEIWRLRFFLVPGDCGAWEFRSLGILELGNLEFGNRGA